MASIESTSSLRQDIRFEGSERSTALGNLLGALLAPRAAFARLVRRPRWGLALVVLLVAGIAESLVISTRIDRDRVLRQTYVERGIQVSEESLQSQLDLASRFGLLFAVAGPTVSRLFVVAAVSAVLFLLFRSLGESIRWKPGVAVCVHGLLPLAVRSLLAAGMALPLSSLGPEDLERGLVASTLDVFFVRDSSAAWIELLGRIDLFHLWCLFLLSLGYRELTRARRSRVALIVAGPWVLWILLGTLWASLV